MSGGVVALRAQRRTRSLRYDTQLGPGFSRRMPLRFPMQFTLGSAEARAPSNPALSLLNALATNLAPPRPRREVECEGSVLSLQRH